MQAQMGGLHLALHGTVRQIGDEFGFHQLIWFPGYCPKMAMCLRALQMKLLTKDRLTKTGIIQDNVLCYV